MIAKGTIPVYCQRTSLTLYNDIINEDAKFKQLIQHNYLNIINKPELHVTKTTQKYVKKGLEKWIG